MKYEDLTQNVEIMDELNANKDLAYFTNVPSSRNAKKKKIAKNVFLILLFVFTFYTMYLMSTTLNGGSISSLKDVMSHTIPKYFLLALSIALLLIVMDTLKYCFLSKMTVGRFNPYSCFKVGIIGKFYDNITPFASGGQPFQIVYLNKKRYPLGMATAIPSIKYIVQLYSWIIVSIVLFILNSGSLKYLSDPGTAAFIKVVCYIGLIFAISAPTLFAFFAVMPKTAKKVITFFVRLLHKMKIIKNYEKVYSKIINFVNNYQSAFSQITKHRIWLVAFALYCMLDFIVFLSLPYFLLIAIGGAAPSWALLYDVITLNAYSFFAASLMPTPGNSGAIEASYSMVFAPSVVSSGTLFWIVFVWRFFTYYAYILLGIAYGVLKFFKKTFKNKKNSKKENSYE